MIQKIISLMLALRRFVSNGQEENHTYLNSKIIDIYNYHYWNIRSKQITMTKNWGRLYTDNIPSDLYS